MSCGRLAACLALLGASLGCGSRPSAEVPHTPTVTTVRLVADERDRQVLEATLLALLTDPEFNLAHVAPESATIVLGLRSPKGIGVTKAAQIGADLWPDKSIPADAQADLRRRNQHPGTYDTPEAFFGALHFDARVHIADLTGLMSDRAIGAFQEAHPTARGWVQACLPGYSDDGLHAVVRAWVGPSAHGATITAWLVNNDGTWCVEWHELSWYC